MKRLYNTQDQPNYDGEALARAVRLKLHVMFDDHRKRGYSPRDIKAIMDDVTLDMMLTALAGWDGIKVDSPNDG